MKGGESARVDPSSADLTPTDETRWRSRTLERLDYSLLAATPPLFALDWVTHRPHGPTAFALFMIAASPVLLWSARARAELYRWRVYALLAVLFAGCSIGLATVGVAPGVSAVLALAAALAATFLGTRAGVVLAALSVVAFVGIGALHRLGCLAVPPPSYLDSRSFFVWLRIGAMQGVTGLMLVTALGRLLAMYERSLAARTDALARADAEKEHRVRAEAVAREAQKHEAVARLASGVAHDFNNVLLVVLSWADMLRMRPDLSAEAKEGLEEIVQAANRGAQLTRSLLTIGRRDVRVPVATDLTETVRSVVESLRRLLPEDIVIETELAPVPEVLIDPSQAEQIVLNLALNARDAMPDGGTLTLSLESAPGGDVELRVRDTGVGMSQAVEQRIFEPFFTTKPEGQGTGLGLAMVWSVVHGLKGTVSVESEEKRGSVFCIRLPRAALASPGAGAPTETTPRAPTVVATIVVAEDEEPVRAIMVRALKGAGHSVLESATGLGAIEIVRRTKTTIDVLCVDAVLPDHASKRLIDCYLEAFPSGKVLVCSGHVGTEVIRQGIAEGRYAFVAKPFAAGVLVERVNELLSVRRTAAPPRRS
jgi:signal transduction histidine kinase